MTNTQTLVAIDWDNANLSIDRVKTFLGGALISSEFTMVECTKRGELTMLPAFKVKFDARQARNTEVQGVAYRSGFLSHIE